MNRKILMFFMLSITIFINAANAFTIVFSSKDYVWHKSTITFHLNASGCGMSYSKLSAYTQSALDLWNNVPTSNLYLKLGPEDTTTTYTIASTNAANGTASDPIIFCDTNYGTDFGATNIPASETKKTIVNNQTIGDYITLNATVGATGNIFTSSVFSDNTYIIILAHEIGHVLGLGHSSEPNAIMSYSHSSYDNTVQNRLGQDDVDGISYLYPRNEAGGGAGLMGCGPSANAQGNKKPFQNNFFSFFETMLIALLLFVSVKLLKRI